MMNYRSYERKVRITGTLQFQTAFHIGSGNEGDLATDMGVIQNHDGSPVLPGSTLKGSCRSHAEKLAEYFNMKACLLDSSLSGNSCVSDERYRRDQHDQFKALKTESEKLAWLEHNLCDVCVLFGSPLHASRIFFQDAQLTRWSQSMEIRDGVCIGRDSETARHRAKYNFEVVPAGAEFFIIIDMENPHDHELALVGAVLSEWENGFRIGGFTSRGLGNAVLINRAVHVVDYTDKKQLRAWLLRDRKQQNEYITAGMSNADELLETSLTNLLDSLEEKTDA